MNTITAPASSIWSVATALAVLMAVGVGIHGLRPDSTADRASAALMRELAANVSWRAPSDHLPGLADRSLIAELPEIPMVDTSPEEFHL